MSLPATTPEAPRIRVKFRSKAVLPQNLASWLSRFPGSVPRWGACDFIFDATCRDYDWLVVYDDLPGRDAKRSAESEETLPAAQTRTLLITTEPSTIKVYGSRYLRQFEIVLTSQEPWVIRHPGAIYSQTGLIWYYGSTGGSAGFKGSRGSYDSISTYLPTEKTADISTVCSTKQQKHTLHHDRYEFTQKLKAAIPTLDVFGHGVRYAEDKADTLDPYRYHVSIENQICPHHWTEKLGDAFLGVCVPFYHGCPNYADYFPAESVIPINIHQFEASLETIQRAIRDREYEKRRPAVLESRRLYLDKYSTFAQLARIITERHQAGTTLAGSSRTICSRHQLRRKSLITALASAWEKTRVGLRHKLAKQPASAKI